MTHNSTLHQSIEAGRQVPLPDWPTKHAWVADAFETLEHVGVELTASFAPELTQLVQQELAEVDGDTIRLTRNALLDVDWLLPRFYLPQHRGIGPDHGMALR